MSHYLHRNLYDVKAKQPLIHDGTALSEVPRDWLEKVEPKIARRGFDGCWISYHPVNRWGVPILRYREDGKQHNTTVAKYVMGIFWDFPDGYFVKRTCDYVQCVNPNHLFLCPNAWGM